MTLIIGLLTDHYVVMASDRRVTERRGKAIVSQEDADTKMFNLCGHFLMGFTGLARIDGYRIERWVADRLADKSPSEYFLTLANELTSTFRRLGLNGVLSHTFLAIGYAKERTTEELRPILVTISNSFDQNGHWNPNAVGDVFQARGEMLGNRRHLLCSVGWPMPRDVRRRSADLIRRLTKGTRDNPEQSIGVIIDALRKTAETSQNHVGRNVLLATLPRVAVPAPYISIHASRPDMRTEPTTFFLRQEARTASEAETYAPALICPELIMIGLQLDPERLPPPPKGY